MKRSRREWLQWGLVIGALVAMSACGVRSESEVVEPEVRAVLRVLPLHASIEEVESQLGPPLSRSLEGDEVVLNYNDWHLTFVNGALTSRSREVWFGPANATVGGRALNEAILSLKRGMTRRDVEMQVGQPTSYELVFLTNLHRPDEVV